MVWFVSAVSEAELSTSPLLLTLKTILHRENLSGLLSRHALPVPSIFCIKQAKSGFKNLELSFSKAKQESLLGFALLAG